MTDCAVGDLPKGVTKRMRSSLAKFPRSLFVTDSCGLGSACARVAVGRSGSASGFVFGVVNEETFIVEGSSGSVPPMQLSQKASHDDDHGFLSWHGKAFSVIEFSVETLTSYQWQRDLT